MQRTRATTVKVRVLTKTNRKTTDQIICGSSSANPLTQKTNDQLVSYFSPKMGWCFIILKPYMPLKVLTGIFIRRYKNVHKVSFFFSKWTLYKSSSTFPSGTCIHNLLFIPENNNLLLLRNGRSLRIYSVYLIFDITFYDGIICFVAPPLKACSFFFFYRVA